jgi:hypothetical protein
LEGPGGPETETKKMLGVATNYYKNLFQRETRPNISLDADFFTDEDHLKASKK